MPLCRPLVPVEAVAVPFPLPWLFLQPHWPPTLAVPLVEPAAVVPAEAVVVLRLCLPVPCPVVPL
jgi:hypothetical protein